MGVRGFEAFSGYQSQGLAWNRYTKNYKCVGTSEIEINSILVAYALHGKGITLNKFPSKEVMHRELKRCNVGYNSKLKKVVLPKNRQKLEELYQAHKVTKNFGDISLINLMDLPDFDFFSYSFPCQDISMAGKQKGLVEGSGTRSSLLWECEKVIDWKRPKYLMMENVKNLVGKKHKHDFDRWLEVLDSLGYNNYWKVINAKNCGVPQNRERVFCVSIRKDIDPGTFKFYDDFDSGVRLKDILEDHVDEKYYLSDEKTKGLIDSLIEKGYQDLQSNWTTNGNSYCIDANYAKGTSKGDIGKGRRTHIVEQTNEIIKVGSVNSSQDGVIVSPTHSAGHGNCPKIIEGCRIVGRNPDNPKSREPGLKTEQMVEVNENPNISNCLTTVQKDTMILERPLFRIRKLSPRECFRLMGLNDKEIDLVMSSGLKDSPLYKMAGNSIVVTCMKFLKQLI